MKPIEARRRIRDAIRGQGPYWNQVVTFTLQRVAREHGEEAANNMIEELGLEAYGFCKEVKSGSAN